MNRLMMTVGAASMLAFAGAVSAEERLSFAQMDAVTAGGNAAADAFANAFGYDTWANTYTETHILITEVVYPQVGVVERTRAEALAWSDAGAVGDWAVSVAGANAAGVADGDLLADTVSFTDAVADGQTPASWSTASNTTLASTLLRGFTASASSASGSFASLQNP